MTTGRTHWISQASAPTRGAFQTTNLTATDRNHLTVAVETMDHNFETHSYNINNDEWSKIFEIKNASTTYPCIAYEPTSKQIFISASNRLKIFDTQQQNVKSFSSGLQLSFNSQLICIGGTCHIIGYNNHGVSHHIFNQNLLTLQHIHLFADMIRKGLDKVGLIHV